MVKTKANLFKGSSQATKGQRAGLPGAKVNATQAALARFQKSQSHSSAPPPLPRAVPDTKSSSEDTCCIRCPVVLKKDFLRKAYKKKPSFVVGAVLDLMRNDPGFASQITRAHGRRAELLSKYSFGKDVLRDEEDAETIDEDLNFLEEPKVKKQKPIKTKVEETPVGDAPGSNKASVVPVKNSLPLSKSFIRKWDSKSKCVPGMETKRLKAGAPDFWQILDAKFLSTAEHAAPLINDKNFGRVEKDNVTIAAAGMMWDTLKSYRDVWWLRCLANGKTFGKYVLEWKGKETSTQRKKALHSEVCAAIKKFKESVTYKKRKTQTKMQELFLTIFPDFTTSPVYILGDK